MAKISPRDANSQFREAGSKSDIQGSLLAFSLSWLSTRSRFIFRIRSSLTGEDLLSDHDRASKFLKRVKPPVPDNLNAGVPPFSPDDRLPEGFDTFRCGHDRRVVVGRVRLNNKSHCRILPTSF